MEIEAVLLKKQIGSNFYHSTFDDFEYFDMNKSMFGMHFGTKETALSRIDVKCLEEIRLKHSNKSKEKQEEEAKKIKNKAILINVDLDYKNPLLLGENRLGMWSPSDVLREVIEEAERNGIDGITEQDIEDFYADEISHNGVLMVDLDYEDYGSEEFKQEIKEHLFIRDWLESKGYDSIVYENKFEKGGKSILVLREEQIKIVSKEHLAQKNKISNKIA